MMHLQWFIRDWFAGDSRASSSCPLLAYGERESSSVFMGHHTGVETQPLLSAGRRELGEAVQALCFLAGANSIFYGDKLLTTGNPEAAADRELMGKLGLRPA